MTGWMTRSIRRTFAKGHVCPACNAQRGEPCTSPTIIGRRPVAWVHHAREDLIDA